MMRGSGRRVETIDSQSAYDALAKEDGNSSFTPVLERQITNARYMFACWLCSMNVLSCINDLASSSSST